MCILLLSYIILGKIGREASNFDSYLFNAVESWLFYILIDKDKETIFQVSFYHYNHAKII